MNRMTSTRFLATAALALGAFGAATAAHARSDVFFSIGVPGVYVESAPVYVQPRPVYVEPRPVYVQPPIYGYAVPTEVYVNPGRAVYGYPYDNQRDWRQAEWRRRNWQRQHEWEEHHRRGRDWD